MSKKFETWQIAVAVVALVAVGIVLGKFLPGIYYAQAKPPFKEAAEAEYKGPHNLSSYDCHTITRSSFINRVCYKKSDKHLLVQLQQTYFEHCQVDPLTVQNFLSAPSMGRFYNSNLKRSFKCREGWTR
jgi:hypothetical protein